MRNLGRWTGLAVAVFLGACGGPASPDEGGNQATSSSGVVGDSSAAEASSQANASSGQQGGSSSGVITTTSSHVATSSNTGGQPTSSATSGAATSSAATSSGATSSAATSSVSTTGQSSSAANVTSVPAGYLCEETCRWSGDGECDDGGQGSLTSACAYGTDCLDCGPRAPAGTSSSSMGGTSSSSTIASSSRPASSSAAPSSSMIVVVSSSSQGNVSSSASGPAAPVVIINELLTDSTGSPDKEAFVELFGAAGTSLTGFELVGINGNGGTEYNRITLTGSIGSNGFYVVAHPQASVGTLGVAAQTSTLVDYQNGPDSVHLRFNGVTVDAVAYGSFAAADVAAGEGAPALAPPLGQALGRNGDQADTQDNNRDFLVRAPTPGAPNQMTGNAPVARLTCPTLLRVRESFLLDAGASSDVEGPISSYAFNPGDGTALQTVTTPTLSYAYAHAGTFTAAVTVRDATGFTDRATCTIVVENQAPVARLSCPPMLNLGESGLFDASLSTDVNLDALTWSFVFGAGGAAQPSANGQLMHAFTAGGTFTVSVTVTDEGGLTNSASCDVGVIDHPPVAVLACPMGATRGVSAAFSAQGSTDDAAIASYVFDFGDGSAPVSQPGQAATHVFTSGGTFMVALTVRDTGNQTATDSCMLTVEEPCGNGVLDPGEQCDDGNSSSFDGCSSTCAFECAPGQGGSSRPGALALGNYARACSTASWSSWYGYTEHWYTFTRSAPFSLDIDVHDPANTSSNYTHCPQQTQASPCNSGPMEGVSTLYSETGTVVSGGSYSCGEMTSQSYPALRNLPAGTYWLKIRVDSHGAGFDCDGSVYYVMDFLFGAPR